MVAVQFHAEPPPNDSLKQVLYLDTSNRRQELTAPREVYTLSMDDPALLTYVYTFDVPNANVSADHAAVVDISVTLTQNVCVGDVSFTRTIPVTTRSSG